MTAAAYTEPARQPRQPHHSRLLSNLYLNKVIAYLFFFLTGYKDKGNKKGDLIQDLLFLSFIHTNKQLFPKYTPGSQSC